jgi:hypothetical protein
MSTFETVSTFFLGTAFLISCYSVMAASAAKRSALAAEDQAAQAEKQARHAETRADAALAQARAAERQVEIMREASTFEGIARLARGRRLVLNCGDAIERLTIVALRGNDGNAIARCRDALEQCLVDLEDAMYLFPPAMWRLVSAYVEQVETDLPALLRQAGDKGILENLEALTEALGHAMEIEVGRRWGTIEAASNATDRATVGDR